MKLHLFLFYILQERKCEKLGTLRGSGGTFFLPSQTTQKPVGEFQVNKRVGTVSGVFCDEMKEKSNYKMMCTDGNAEDSAKGLT